MAVASNHLEVPMIQVRAADAMEWQSRIVGYAMQSRKLAFFRKLHLEPRDRAVFAIALTRAGQT